MIVYNVLRYIHRGFYNIGGFIESALLKMSLENRRCMMAIIINCH